MFALRDWFLTVSEMYGAKVVDGQWTSSIWHDPISLESSVWYQINRKGVTTIQIWFEFTKFRKDFSVWACWELNRAEEQYSITIFTVGNYSSQFVRLYSLFLHTYLAWKLPTTHRWGHCVVYFNYWPLSGVEMKYLVEYHSLFRNSIKINIYKWETEHTSWYK